MALSLNEPKYALEPSDYRCSSCAGEVVVDSTFFSAIFFEGESLRRRTYCTDCWSGPGDTMPPVYAFWRSRRPPPEAPPRKLRFDPDLVLELFRRLGQDLPSPAAREGAGAPPSSDALLPDEEKTRLRLVLALLLLRRKYLVFESAASLEGREWLKLSEKADPSRLHHVENPTLSDAQLEEVKSGLGELLQMDL